MHSTVGPEGMVGRFKPRHAWWVLVLGVLASAFTAWQVQRDVQQDAERQFANTCDQVTLKLRERLESYALILRGAAGLFGGSNEVTRSDWRAYVGTLQAQRTVPGVQGIGFAKVVPANQLEAHQAQVRAEGFRDYSVRPKGPRALYTAIVYLEPFAGRNLRAFGYDMFSEAVRREAMEQARDTGEATLSGKVELVQETGTDVQAGTLMYMPVYRSAAEPATLAQRRYALVGWTYSPYRMNDLMAGVLPGWQQREGKAVDLHIYDGPQPYAEDMIFDSKAARGRAAGGRPTQTRALDVFGRQWLLAFSDLRPAQPFESGKAWATLAAGLALSGLLFALMRSVIHTRATAARIAGQLTEEIRGREVALRESEAFKAAVLDSVPVAIAVLDAQGVILSVNAPWRRFAQGHAPGRHIDSPLQLPGSNHLLAIAGLAVTGGDAAATAAGEGLRRVLGGQVAHFSMDYPLAVRQGTLWVHMTAARMRATGAGAVVTYASINERKQAEEKLQLAASVFSHAREGIMITQLDGTIVDVNEAFTRITGYPRDEVVGRNPRVLKSGRQAPEAYADMWRSLAEHGHWVGELWNRRKNGELFAEMQTISTVRDAQGRARHYVCLFADITVQKMHESDLEHSAHYDALTGLPNRTLLADRLAQGLRLAHRHSQVLAVVFLDLDGFKQVNDEHGHEAGDHLLVTLARRMREVIRDTDTLARLGGDEFVAVLGDQGNSDTRLAVLGRLLAAAAQPVFWGTHTLRVSASLGVAYYPQADEVDADLLLRQADQAMYRAKQAGRSRYVVFGADPA